MIKAVKVLNVFSTLLFAIVLLTIYAYLPISVDLNLEWFSAVHKQSFFYQALGVFIILNILLRVIFGLGFKKLQQLIRGWLRLLICIVNIYLIVLVAFIGVWNNATSIAPAGYSYLNYIGPSLLIFWIGGLIFLAFKKA